MQRICFRLQVKSERVAEYCRRHAAVWPSMLAEITASGRHNYSLFLSPDGLLIGYFETEDLDASQRFLAASSVAADWEREMGDFFVALDGARPDQGFDQLSEVFNLDDQRAATPQNRITP